MPDVIVIGAGLAGLRAATDLVAAGADVMVVEARERVGGRVFSHRFGNGQVAERGAEFIDGTHSEVLALAQSMDLVLSERPLDVDAGGVLVDAGGRAVPWNLHSTVVNDWPRWEDALSAIAAAADDAEAEQRTLQDAIDSLGAGALSRLVIGREVRTEFMLPPDQVSQRFAGEVHRRRPAQRERHRVVGGNDQLATALARPLGTRVRLGTPVRSVDHLTGAVHLLGGETLRADTVVAAVPLPVLARLWPDLPAPLASVGYGIGGKISVQFARRVWRDYSRNGTVLSDRQWGQLWESTDDQAGDSGVLTNLLSSHDGSSFAALPEAPDQLIREIDRIFPGAAGLAGERVHSDWTNDPYSLGCYACFGPGQWTASRDALAAKHDRLVIAGEHTDGFTGFMEGALRSGASAAATVGR